MRIFDAVRVPGAKLTVASEDSEPVAMPVPKDFLTAATDWVRVVADDCSDWYWKSEREFWRYDEHFGPLRLPFDKMWVEWVVPSRVHTEGRGWHSRTEAGITGGAALLESHEPSKHMAGRAVQTITVSFLMESFGRLLTIPAMQLMHVDADGQYVFPHQYVGASQTTAQLADGMSVGFDPAWLAIGLMNCKNVQITETKPPEKLAKATLKRRGVRPNSYHVISLPGRPSIRSNKQAAAAAGGAVPLHLVRGHFKTYTAEKPLLGKSTGTYWWGWHARGSEEAGRVDKSYKVGPKDGQK
jgi:hypothetical protein